MELVQKIITADTAQQYDQAMKLAWEAATYSEDPSTQLGSVVIPRLSDIMIAGYNHLTRNVPAEVWQDRPQKLRRVLHAEEHSIIRCASLGAITRGGTLVCPWACCIRCASFIVASGISTVVVDPECMTKSPERWLGEIKQAWAYLIDCDVEIIELPRTFKKPTTRFNGEEWSE